MVVFVNMWNQERVGTGICRHRRGKIADITGSFPYNSYHLIALREMAIKIGFFRANVNEIAMIYPLLPFDMIIYNQNFYTEIKKKISEISIILLGICIVYQSYNIENYVLKPQITNNFCCVMIGQYCVFLLN